MLLPKPVSSSGPLENDSWDAPVLAWVDGRNLVSCLRSFGLEYLVLTALPFIVSVIVGPLWNLSSGKYNERSWHITCMMLLAMVGFIISAATLNVAARCVACFCYAVGVYAVNSSILGWVFATLGQTMQKKVISLGFVNIMANASYIYNPYLFPSSHDPEYTTGMATEAAFTAGVIICVWALRAWLMATDAKLRRSGEDHGLLYAY